MSPRRKGKLPPEVEAKARALVRAQDADARLALEDVAHRDLKPAKPLKPAKSSQRGGPSKVERDYARYLASLEAAGQIVYFVAQPEPIELAHRCTFTPDYLVMPAEGKKYYVECKGRKGSRPYYREDARVKTKVAARVLSQRGDPPGSAPLALYVVWPKKGGGWCSEQVKP